MKFLLDENVRKSVAGFLKQKGFDVKVIGMETKAGLSDLHVLRLANQEKRILITNDTDFGDLVFNFGHPIHGLILFRLRIETKENILNLLEKVFADYQSKLEKHYTVISENQIRFRLL